MLLPLAERIAPLLAPLFANRPIFMQYHLLDQLLLEKYSLVNLLRLLNAFVWN